MPKGADACVTLCASYSNRRTRLGMGIATEGFDWNVIVGTLIYAWSGDVDPPRRKEHLVACR